MTISNAKNRLLFDTFLDSYQMIDTDKVIEILIIYT